MVAAEMVAADRGIQNRAPLPLSRCYCSAGIMKLNIRHLLWSGHARLSVRQGILRGVRRAKSVEPSWWASGSEYNNVAYGLLTVLNIKTNASNAQLQAFS